MFACFSTPNKALLRVREVVMYLALVEGQAGVDVLTVNSLQKAAASVERRLLLPCLELAEQLTVHLQVRNYVQSHHRLLQKKLWEREHSSSCCTSYLPTLAYNGLRGRRVRLRPQHGGGGALVPAVALPEGSLHASSRSHRGKLTHRGGRGGEHESLQSLNLRLEDVDLKKETEILRVSW